MDFEDWMSARGLSDSSVKKYAGAIDGPLTEWGRMIAGSGKAIRAINDPNEFAALAELIAETDIFEERNGRGNHMYSSALKNYAGYLSARSRLYSPKTSGPFFNELALLETDSVGNITFEPSGQEDARSRVLQEVVRRQGQASFRAKLISAYEGRCAITGCSQLVTLEAAHITPYLGPATNMASNGILLRADIHTLWDLGLIAIDPKSLIVAISPGAHEQEYQRLAGRIVFQPTEAAARASKAALGRQWEIFQGHVKS